MDPTVLLDELRAALAAASNSTALAAKNLQWEVAAEKMQALDDWLSRGGFLPRQWDLDAVTRDLDEATAWHQADLISLQHAEPSPRVRELLVELTPDPWGTHASLGARSGAISAGEAVDRKLRGDS